jgi:hypothetical protein
MNQTENKDDPELDEFLTHYSKLSRPRQIIIMWVMNFFVFRRRVSEWFAWRRTSSPPRHDRGR